MLFEFCIEFHVGNNWVLNGCWMKLQIEVLPVLKLDLTEIWGVTGSKLSHLYGFCPFCGLEGIDF